MIDQLYANMNQKDLQIDRFNSKLKEEEKEKSKMQIELNLMKKENEAISNKLELYTSLINKAKSMAKKPESQIQK